MSRGWKSVLFAGATFHKCFYITATSQKNLHGYQNDLEKFLRVCVEVPSVFLQKFRRIQIWSKVSLKLSTNPESWETSVASIVGWYMTMPILKVLS